MHTEHWNRLPGSASHNIIKSQWTVFNKTGRDDTTVLATRQPQEWSQTVPYLFVPLKSIRSVAILRFTSAPLQFFERAKSVERFWVKFYSPTVVQIWVILLITVCILLITVFILSFRVYISSRSGFLLWILAPWHQWCLGTWQHGRCEDLLQNLGDLFGIHGNKRPTCW